MVTCGEEPVAVLDAKWVGVSNGYMWRGAWGGPGCQVGKCQQWLHRILLTANRPQARTGIFHI